MTPSNIKLILRRFLDELQPAMITPEKSKFGLSVIHGGMVQFNLDGHEIEKGNFRVETEICDVKDKDLETVRYSLMGK